MAKRNYILNNPSKVTDTVYKGLHDMSEEDKKIM